MQGKVPEHGCTVQGSESMLQAVRELVEAEHRRAAAADTMAAAESLVRGDGKGLLQRICHLEANPVCQALLLRQSIGPGRLQTAMQRGGQGAQQGSLENMHAACSSIKSTIAPLCSHLTSPLGTSSFQLLWQV